MKIPTFYLLINITSPVLTINNLILDHADELSSENHRVLTQGNSLGTIDNYEADNVLDEMETTLANNTFCVEETKCIVSQKRYNSQVLSYE